MLLAKLKRRFRVVRAGVSGHKSGEALLMPGLGLECARGQWKRNRDKPTRIELDDSSKGNEENLNVVFGMARRKTRTVDNTTCQPQSRQSEVILG
jgi:hypothetical protein